MISVNVRARHGRWTPLIHRSQLPTVMRRKVYMLRLFASGFEVTLAGRLHLDCRRMRLNANTTIETDVFNVYDRVLRHDDAILVHIGDTYGSEVRHCTVISEFPTPPLAADKADAAVAIAVVNAAVETNMRSPVARVPSVYSSFITPIARRPQQAGPRRLHPHARDPEVARIAVGPVAWGPDVTRCRQGRLLVNRQGGRSDVDR